MAERSLTGVINWAEAPTKRRWNAATGWVAVRTFRGQTVQADAFVSDTVKGLPLGYTDIEVVDEGLMCTISATYALKSSNPKDPVNATPPDPISTEWTMPGNTVERHLFGHPHAVALNTFYPHWTTLIDFKVRQIRALLDGKSDVTTVNTPDTTSVNTLINTPIAVPKKNGASPSATLLDYSDQLTKILLARTESFPESQYVLRKVQVLNRASTVQIAHNGVNKIISYESLTSNGPYGEPTLVTDPIIHFEGLRYQDGDNTKPIFWLKQTPSLDKGTGGKVILTQEYWSTLAWYDFIYGAAL